MCNTSDISCGNKKSIPLKRSGISNLTSGLDFNFMIGLLIGCLITEIRESALANAIISSNRSIDALLVVIDSAVSFALENEILFAG